MRYALGLKIDVDTYRGAKKGVGRLLDILSRHSARATFFVAFGPDCSGRAFVRVFRKRGFLAKMIRTNPARCYGIEALFRGTLLPPVHVGRRCADEIARIRSEGHEVAIHGWNHCRWQDDLERMSREQIRHELERAYKSYEAVFGCSPLGCAAPGWVCSAASLAVQDGIGFLYASDARGTSPFFPMRQERRFHTLQIPTTLPTLDEELGRGGLTLQEFNARVIGLLCRNRLNVYTLHAETEGMAFAEAFDELLTMMRGHGTRFLTMSEAASLALRDMERIPHCEVRLRAIPGRAGVVACQGVEAPRLSTARTRKTGSVRL